jgi:hypothetical protein
MNLDSFPLQVFSYAQEGREKRIRLHTEVVVIGYTIGRAGGLGVVRAGATVSRVGCSA